MPRGERIPEHLVDRLADPFEVFPLMHALCGLGGLIEENYAALYSQYEDVAPKCRVIQLEQGLEAVSIILGAGFVAAQAILTSTFVQLKWLRDLNSIKSIGGAGLPQKKKDLFEIAAFVKSGVPDIAGINALANYFKHSSEWPRDWSTPSKSLERETIDIVYALGLRPKHTDNLFIGASALSFGGADGLSKMADRIQEWRESVRDEVRRLMADAGAI